LLAERNGAVSGMMWADFGMKTTMMPRRNAHANSFFVRGAFSVGSNLMLARSGSRE